MEEGRRSGDPLGIVVKKKNSSGCLIVRKKSDGVGGRSLGLQKVFEPKKEKKRPRLVTSDSGSTDELLMLPRMQVAPETLRVCNGSSVFDKDVVEESEFGRKRNRLEPIRRNDDGLIARNEEIETKRSRLDVFEFDDYDGIDGEKTRRDWFDDSRVEVRGRRLLGSVAVGQSGDEREFEAWSSRHVAVGKRKNMYFDRTGRFDRGDHTDKNRFEIERDGARPPTSMLREKLSRNSDEPLRLQGKNGVLKVMVNKSKKMGGLLKNYDHRVAEGNGKGSMSEEIAKKNILSRPSFYSETKLSEKLSSFVRKGKNQLNLQKPLSTRKTKGSESDSEDSDTSLRMGLKNVEAHNSMKSVISEGENTPPHEEVPTTTIKEEKVKRGSGTEKQKLRERIREMLLSAGWTIDYRPRRNRDYLDAVYINPTGTAYWSIIKAYDALQKQLDDEENEAKPSGDSSPFTPIADEVLSKLTRKTRKKIEKEMKKKTKDDGGIENLKQAGGKRNARTKHYMESSDSGSHEEKLISFIKKGGKPMNKMNENGVFARKSRSQDSNHHFNNSIDKQSSGSNSHQIQGRKNRKLGRYTLLVRNSKKGMNSETDGFVPYSGKRTLLSWLIDSGTAQLSQKVQYMNRRRTRAMLEGWITRDGIHCGCCSKILPVSKFEIHAGSKLRQPYQNIYLDSGVSLLQCQIDAWNRQDEPDRIGFHSVDFDGDDPNDDTCGICGDGGDLICCDSCPSTFHQSCLDIQMLPPGDWHCPNCTCKFCGEVNRCTAKEDDTTVCVLLTCSLCEKKFHESCIHEMDVLSIGSSSSLPSFCGKKCRELFEHLQKYLGIKHELEAGFSWSLIHRIDADSDSSQRGLPQRVECNSKLAVALTVMDECFLPIVDRRSGSNLIHNVFYNCGSNFNRLNYSGFYTAILERGDEIISAASIRFHGTDLAEMPFIGTRHIYRRQGMFRRLFCAIELALCSLKVEKMIIPAIAELMHTWTEGFAFNPIEESLKKEMRSLNMLVFPGIDMLQKLILKPENINGGITASTGAKQMVLEGKHGITPKVANKSNMESSAGHDSHEFVDTGVHDGGEINGKVVADSDSQCPDFSLNGASIMSNSLDASRGLKVLVLSDRTLCSDSHPGDKIAESTTDRKHLSGVSHDGLAMEPISVLDSQVEGNSQSSREGDMDGAHEMNLNAACSSVSLNDTSVMGSSLDASPNLKIPVFGEETICSGSHLGDKFADSANDIKCVFPSDTSYNEVKMENTEVLDSPLEGKIRSSGEDDMDVDREVNVNVVCRAVSSNGTSVMCSSLDTFNELKIPVSSEETTCSDAHAVNKLAESATNRKCPDLSHDTLGMENKSGLNFPDEGNNQSPEMRADEIDVNDACVEPTLSSGEIFAENATKETNENLNSVSVSSSHGAVEGSMQINSDPDNQITCEGGGTLSVVSHVSPDAMQCKETILPTFGDSSETDLLVMQNDSSQ